jgi:integrase
MEARPWNDGKTVTYRYHPVGGKPVNLGTDRAEACRKVLDMNGAASDAGTVLELWRAYLESAEWKRLTPGTQRSYTENSRPLLRAMGGAQVTQVKPKHINKYLRDLRSDAPVVANREVALLSNLLNLAVERGDIDFNPCKQIRRNPEQPRTVAPEVAVLERFASWLAQQTPQRRIIGMAAEYASLAGNRQVEFRPLCWPQVDLEAGVIRVKRAKQRKGKRLEVVEVIGITPRLAELLERLKALNRGCLYVFPTRDDNMYSERGFRTLWQRCVRAALEQGVLAAADRFTFHDLRAYYATRHKLERGALPDLHANPATTARVYDRSKEVKRSAL